MAYPPFSILDFKREVAGNVSSCFPQLLRYQIRFEPVYLGEMVNVIAVSLFPTVCVTEQNEADLRCAILNGGKACGYLRDQINITHASKTTGVQSHDLIVELTQMRG